MSEQSARERVRYLEGQLKAAEDEIRDLRADNAQLRARQTADVVLPEQRDVPSLSDALTPRQEFEDLLQVHGWPEEQA